ncbi:MAG: carbamoyltransferase HypF [Gemmatimonadaceae bacterium]
MLERRVIAVEGTVQGVGFRPFVHGLANALELHGFVRNSPDGVVIDVQGDRDSIDRFLHRLTSGPPVLAAIERVRSHIGVARPYLGFSIAPSEERRSGVESDGVHSTVLPPDVATCDACLAETLDPSNRRYKYPFTNCTHCGPRFTIIRDVPYDRARTTMTGFEMCERCRHEYENPADRRFHAQPISCWDCGPTLVLRAPSSPEMLAMGSTSVPAAAASLARGGILAVKGIGGYHLACDAANGEAVAQLRARKRRDAKPLAIMVADVEQVRELCAVSDAEAALLKSPERPIVLLAKRRPSALAEAVAHGSGELGVMLPYTPLHHLLLAAVARPLVMTSGNTADEPIAYDDDDALTRLGAIYDVVLTHDRPIETGCDDSVVRVLRGAPSFVRRSRGFTPRALAMAIDFTRPVLAVGGHMKNTFCLGVGRRALLSHHIGDLEHPTATTALRASIDHYCRLFDIQPAVVAHDLHPDYRSTRLADSLDVTDRIAVQHHHAHVASCMAEHGVTDPVIGVAFDGAGLGSDGAIWGGEFLLVDGERSERLAHLGYVPLPGGDACAREPWRAAAAHLMDAYGDRADSLSLPLIDRVGIERWSMIRRMMERRAASPMTSSAGRLFDAVAAIVGLHDVTRFEGQAAMALEEVADRATDATYPVEYHATAGGWVLETAPLIRAVTADVLAGRSTAEIAGAFHNALGDLIVETATRVAEKERVVRVALTGGVFQNALLTERTADGLARRGLEVLLHRRVPCNDGGLALGQAYVAAFALSRSREV